MRHVVDAETLRCSVCGSREALELTACPGEKPAGPTLRVVPMRDTPPLTDIAGMLEQFAKDIREGRVQAQRALMVIEDQDGDPQVYGWGQSKSAFHDLGLLDMAKEVVKDCFVEEQPEKAG